MNTMRSFMIAVALIASCICACGVLAQEEKEEVPEGMEKVAVGKNAAIVVPKGTRIIKRGDHVLLENADVYVARAVEELEKRMDKLEAAQKDLKEKIALVNAALEDLKSSKLISSPTGGN